MNSLAPMQIGIDSSFLVAPYKRTGIYTYIRRMLEGLYRLAAKDSVALFISNHPNLVDRSLFNELQASFPKWSVKVWDLPRWAYKIRVRFSSYSRMDLFHFPSITTFFENITTRTNVFTIPDLTFMHFPQYHTAGNASTWPSFCERAIKHGDMILTYSEHTKQDLSRTLGVPEQKIHVTPLAAGAEFRPLLDRDSLRQQLAAFGLRDQRYILSVGTLEPRKNQALLIRSFSRLIKGDPSLPHKLVFAGGKGWNYEPIFDAVKQEGLEDRVQFLGRSDPLEVLYNGADLMVYPSLYEGFGLPPLEAMACGTPVITSNRSSLPEVVGDAALTVEPQDENALCEAMKRVLQDDKLREELATRGVQRSRQFSWERTAAETLEAYRAAHRMKS